MTLQAGTRLILTGKYISVTIKKIFQDHYECKDLSGYVHYVFEGEYVTWDEWYK